MNKFKRHAEADERISSARNLVKGLLKMRGITTPHRRTMLRRHALFLLTEAEQSDKHKTRFCSEAALKAAPKGKRHDHVFQRSKMVEKLLDAKRNSINDIDSILDNAIGCTITIQEHKRLNKYEGYDGWERYRKARIVVIDTKTGKPSKRGHSPSN